jgi:hypothetical protein
METNVPGVHIGSVAAGASVAVASNDSAAVAMSAYDATGAAAVAVAHEGETVAATTDAPEQGQHPVEQKTEDPRLTSLKAKHDAFFNEMDENIRAGRMDIVQDLIRYETSKSRLGSGMLGSGGSGGGGLVGGRFGSGGSGGSGMLGRFGGLGGGLDTPVTEWSMKPISGFGGSAIGGFSLGNKTPPELMMHINQKNGKLVKVVAGGRELEADSVTMEVVVKVPGVPPFPVPFNAPLEVHVPEGGYVSFHTHTGSIEANVHGNAEHISSTAGAVTVHANEVKRAFGPVAFTESHRPAQFMGPL